MKRRILGVIAVALALTGVYVSSPARANLDVALPRAGISLPGSYVNLSTTDLDFRLDESVAIGAQSVRLGFTPGAEPQGIAAVAAIEARGLEAFIIVGDQIVPGQWTPSTYSTFVTHTVTTFPNVRLFECGNEPNLQGLTPAQYAALCNAGFKAAHKARSTVKWVDGATGIGMSARDQFNNWIAPVLPLVAGKLDYWSYHDAGDPYDHSWYRGAAWAFGPISGDITNSVRHILDGLSNSAVQIICSEYDQWTADQGVNLTSELTDTRKPASWVYTMIAEPSLPGYGLYEGGRTAAWYAYQAAA